MAAYAYHLLYVCMKLTNYLVIDVCVCVCVCIYIYIYIYIIYDINMCIYIIYI